MSQTTITRIYSTRSQSGAPSPKIPTQVPPKVPPKSTPKKGQNSTPSPKPKIPTKTPKPKSPKKGQNRSSKPKSPPKAPKGKQASAKGIQAIIPQDASSFPLVNQFFGLSNLGNTCWLNAGFQFMRASLRWLPVLEIPDYVTDKNLAKSFINLINSSHAPNPAQLVFEVNQIRIMVRDKLDKEKVVPALLFNSGEQHDAHEFVQFMLQRIANWDPSYLHLCTGLTSDILVCNSCHKPSSINQSFTILSLDLPSPPTPCTLLNLLTAHEAVEKGVAYKECCNEGTTVDKRIQIRSLPDTLIIQFKRWNGTNHSKNTIDIECPEILTIKEDQYQLISVIIHTKTPHYTALVKTRLGWMVCDDLRTKKIPSLNRSHLKNAYLVAYEKITPPPMEGIQF